MNYSQNDRFGLFGDHFNLGSDRDSAGVSRIGMRMGDNNILSKNEFDYKGNNNLKYDLDGSFDNNGGNMGSYDNSCNINRNYLDLPSTV